MESTVFVYTELQLSLPFEQVNWSERNAALRHVPGLQNKTWLSGIGNHSLGGLYQFDSLANARDFAVRQFPAIARARGAAQTTKLFDGAVSEEASRDLNSMHFGGKFGVKPGAFVYTEAQISLPFAQVPWREVNPTLRTQPGFLHKTWLSGVHTQSVGGFYAFDTIDNATRFAMDYFPVEAAALNAAFTTRVFDASLVADASRDLASPFFI